MVAFLALAASPAARRYGCHVTRREDRRFPPAIKSGARRRFPSVDAGVRMMDVSDRNIIPF
jgi:hypothetical protein